MDHQQSRQRPAFISSIYSFSNPVTDKCTFLHSFALTNIDAALVGNALGRKQSSILMATLFGDNAHVHYHPLMFVCLIWLDYNLHKGRPCTPQCCLCEEPWTSGSKLNWKSNTPCESYSHSLPFQISGTLQRFAWHHQGQPFIIFHIMLLSFTPLRFQSDLRSSAKRCESSCSSLVRPLSPNDHVFFFLCLLLVLITHAPPSPLLSRLSLQSCSN